MSSTNNSTAEPVSAELVARHILWLRRGEKTTSLGLIKMTILCQCWMLGTMGVALYKDGIEAWEHGPMIQSLYDKHKWRGMRPITDPTRDCTQQFHVHQLDLIGKVVDVCRIFTDVALSATLSAEGTPGGHTHPSSMHKVIGRDTIQGYYEQFNNYIACNIPSDLSLGAAEVEWMSAQRSIFRLVVHFLSRGACNIARVISPHASEAHETGDCVERAIDIILKGGGSPPPPPPPAS